MRLATAVGACRSKCGHIVDADGASAACRKAQHGLVDLETWLSRDQGGASLNLCDDLFAAHLQHNSVAALAIGFPLLSDQHFVSVTTERFGENETERNAWLARQLQA